MKTKTDVQFFLEKDEHQETPKGSVFAYFPNEPDFDCYGNKPCYAHVGQHSSCHIDYLAKCERATPGQYIGLAIELESIGYSLNIL